jgi:hypothetical protein
MYDIACNFQRYLKNIGKRELLEKIATLSVPSFHAYGHSAECQIQYSPLYTEGIGLSDGEVMERLWSYLRRFARMTKEMRPAHRVDILTHALLYYSYQRTEKLSKLLALRWRRAQGIHTTALQNFEQLTIAEKIHEQDVLTWIKDEKNFLLKSSASNNLIEALQSSAAKRKFLLQLKSKYADGQKIAKRLSAQINKEMKKIKHIQTELGDNCLDLKTVLDPMVLSSRKKQDIIQNYLLMNRAKEELQILEQDMLNTLSFFKIKSDVLKKHIEAITSETNRTAYTIGIYGLLHQYQSKVDLQYQTALNMFSQFINLPSTHSQESDSTSYDQVNYDDSDTDDEYESYNESESDDD